MRVTAARARRIKTDWRKPMPVSLRVNGHPAKAPWRINMMPAGDGTFYLYLHGDVRRASKTGVGDTVSVEVEFDDGYRPGPTIRTPTWLSVPLRANAGAWTTWKSLRPSRKKEILRYLMNLKSADARSRNVERVVRSLSSPENAKNERSYLRSS